MGNVAGYGVPEHSHLFSQEVTAIRKRSSRQASNYPISRWRSAVLVKPRAGPTLGEKLNDCFHGFLFNFSQIDLSRYRQTVHDYIAACEALLASPELSDHEMQAVEAMMGRPSDALRSAGEDTNQ